MYSVDTTARFEKSVRECKRQGKRIEDLWEVVAILMEDGCLSAEFQASYIDGGVRRSLGVSY